TNVVGSASVEYATADWTATDRGDDYEPVTGVATFAAGKSTVNVNVVVNPDLIDETNEKITLALSSPVGARLARPVAVGTIIDNDLPPGVSIGDSSTLEGTGGTVKAALAIRLTQVSAKTITVT